MRIAGRLSDTTLGDVLGALWRARLTGLVRLTETHGPTAGQRHGIYLREGQVIGVDSPLEISSRSESAQREGVPRELRERVEALFQLREATLSFHVACPSPRGQALPLSPGEYLRGKPRVRDRHAEEQHCPRAPARIAPRRARDEALTMLGLSADASLAEVTRAFRARAAGLHPDRRPGAAAAEKRSLEQRFAALSAAYHALIR